MVMLTHDQKSHYFWSYRANHKQVSDLHRNFLLRSSLKSVIYAAVATDIKQTESNEKSGSLAQLVEHDF